MTKRLKIGLNTQDFYVQAGLQLDHRSKFRITRLADVNIYLPFDKCKLLMLTFMYELACQRSFKIL